MRSFKEQQKSKQKFYYDRGTRDLPELHPGDNVRYIDNKTNKYTHMGTVMKHVQPRSYNIKTEDGAVRTVNQQKVLHTQLQHKH